MNNRVLVWGFSNNRAGTEAVVSNYIRALSDSFVFDVVSYEETPNYGDLFIGDNNLIIAPYRSASPVAFRDFLSDLFEGTGKRYSVLWCNLNSCSNIDILKWAYKIRIPKRIIHAHNSQPVGTPLQKLLHVVNRKKALRCATHLCACSKIAGDYFFKGARYELFPNAIDYEKYLYSEVDRLRLREGYGIQSGSLVIGTVGRLNVQKNHKFLIRLVATMRSRGMNVVCLIAGKGELGESLELEIAELGLKEHILLVGEIENVGAFLSSLDVFVLPSLFEGLPLSLVEAQANGLPCLASDTVSPESSISDQCHFVSLDSEDEWIDKIRKVKRFEFDPDTANADRLSLTAQSERMKGLFLV